MACAHATEGPEEVRWAASAGFSAGKVEGRSEGLAAVTGLEIAEGRLAASAEFCSAKFAEVEFEVPRVSSTEGRLILPEHFSTEFFRSFALSELPYLLTAADCTSLELGGKSLPGLMLPILRRIGPTS